MQIHRFDRTFVSLKLKYTKNDGFWLEICEPSHDCRKLEYYDLFESQYQCIKS